MEKEIKEEMSIYEKLSLIQSELKAPKNRRNSFGNYNYRSAEDILEEAKPICKKHQTTLLLSDELVNIGERYYIKALARLVDFDGISSVETTAFAREEESKKGMDGSQITGTASSYARKYALNGLFNIDDTKDADTDEYTKTTKQEDKITKAQITELTKLVEDIPAMLNYFKVDKIEDITKEQAQATIDKRKQ